jgi:down-regulator of transcription 1
MTSVPPPSRPPAASVVKLINQNLPPGMKMGNDVKDMILEACNEFIQAVSGEASEISDKEGKTTITPEHVVKALEALEFDAYLPAVNEVWEEEKKLDAEQREVKKTKKKAAANAMSAEEALALQTKMFAEAKARYAAGDAGGPGPGPGGGPGPGPGGGPAPPPSLE